MPRYYFHVTDGRVPTIDDDGTVLPNVGAARREAIKAAGGMLASGEADGMLRGMPWHMTVADDSGKTVFSLSFEPRVYD